MLKAIKHIYCDFDGTITKKDTVNTFFELFANEKWKYFEQKWINGEISSRENAIAQVGLLPKIKPKILNEYLNTIELDDYFLEFIEFIQDNNINFTILSDGFDLFIKKTLKRFNLFNIKFFANHLVYENNKLKVEFPNFNEQCLKGSGMCKCAKIKEKEFCYIGDGTSDLCVASKANLLFATKNLAKYCDSNNIEYIKFDSFKDVINVIKNMYN